MLPLLHTCFYITDSGGDTPNALLYFRHCIWTPLRRVALSDLSEGLFDAPTDTLPNNSPRQLSYSTLRLVPKPNGIRPIMNLSYVPKNPVRLHIL